MCLYVCPSQSSEDRPEGCQPKAGTLACAGRRPAYMLVILTGARFRTDLTNMKLTRSPML